MPEFDKIKCDVAMRNGAKCGRSPVDDKGKCICHSNIPDKYEVDFQLEINAILNNVNNTSYDFTHFIFPANHMAFPKLFDKPVYFDHATINSDIGYIDFTDVVFVKEASFIKTIFASFVDFSNAKFNNRAIFHTTDFSGDVYFAGTEFKFYAMFFKTIFRRELNMGASFEYYIHFIKVEFIEKGEIFFNYSHFMKGVVFEDVIAQKPVIFSHTEAKTYIEFNNIIFENNIKFLTEMFNIPIRFSNVEFRGYSYFNGTIYSEDAEFNNCRFIGDTEFIRTQFMAEVNFRNTSFNKVSFEHMLLGEKCHLLFKGDQANFEMFRGVAKLSKIDFSKAAQVVFKNVKLDYISFQYSNIINIRYIDSEFPIRGTKPGRRRMIYDEYNINESIKNNSNRAIKRSLYGKYIKATQIYREIQANFNNSYRYTESGNYFIGEQETVRKAKGRWRQYCCINNLYRITSYYGEHWFRPLGWLLLILVIFPIIFMFCGGIILTDKVDININTTAINYNLNFDSNNTFIILYDFIKAFCANISFLTLNKFELQERLPHLWQKAVFSIEIILIIILSSLFTLALRRKFKRKSF
jgi:hypothetical protein